MLTLIRGLQNNGFTIWFTVKDEFNIMDYNTIRTFASVKKGTGRKVLIKLVNQEEYVTLSNQKEALNWFLQNYNTIA